MILLVMENRMGYIDVKSASGVNFYVQQASGYQSMTDTAGVIRFDKERLIIIGAGVNLKTCVLTAPELLKLAQINFFFFYYREEPLPS